MMNRVVNPIKVRVRVRVRVRAHTRLGQIRECPPPPGCRGPLLKSLAENGLI